VLPCVCEHARQSSAHSVPSRAAGTPHAPVVVPTLMWICRDTQSSITALTTHKLETLTMNDIDFSPYTSEPRSVIPSQTPCRTLSDYMRQHERVLAHNRALKNVTACFYHETHNEIYTGNARGDVHIWTP
jgi:hypothetical protein